MVRANHYGKPPRMGQSIVDWRSDYADRRGPPAHPSNDRGGIEGNSLRELTEESTPGESNNPQRWAVCQFSAR